MAKYLVDANLPYYFSLWNNDDFVHVNDLAFLQTDSQIWDYCLSMRMPRWKGCLRESDKQNEKQNENEELTRFS